MVANTVFFRKCKTQEISVESAHHTVSPGLTDGNGNASVNSSSAHPPPPRADPRELAFFENELANAPPPGQKSCSNAPG